VWGGQGVADRSCHVLEGECLVDRL
jgi:hypothetical protein